MSGCVLIKSVTSTQLDTLGNVQITTIVCAGDTNSNNTGYNPADTACQGSTKGGNYPGDAVNGNYQMLIAYRIPSNTTAPNSFTSSNTSDPPTTACGSGLTFTQNSDFTSQLTTLSPPSSGKKWVGYLSGTMTYATSGCQYYKVTPEFGLQLAADGSPFQGPFNYRVVAGFRQVDESTPGNTSARTVTCGTAITSPFFDGVDGPDGGTTPDMTGICADDPTSSTISGTDLSQSTRDYGVVSGSPASANAGTTVQVPFTLKYNGVFNPFIVFQLHGSTNISGATATPSQSSWNPPTNGTLSMNVSVTVPANTTPGTYNVTLSADGIGSQVRSNTNTLTVGEAFGFSPAPALPSLGTIALNGQAQTKNATMSNFGVIDSPGSSDQGWNVTVVGDSSVGKSPVFKEYCPNGGGCGAHSQGYVSGGYTLPANSLNLNSSSGSWSGGTGTAPSFQCNSGGCPIDAATATKIASAPNGGGTALWTASGFSSSSLALSTSSQLHVLTAAEPLNEQYRLDVVWSLNSGP